MVRTRSRRNAQNAGGFYDKIKTTCQKIFRKFSTTDNKIKPLLILSSRNINSALTYELSTQVQRFNPQQVETAQAPNAQAQIYVKNIVTDIFKNVRDKEKKKENIATAAKAANINKSNPFLNLPNDIIYVITDKLDNIYNSETNYAPLFNACKILNDTGTILKPSIEINKQTTIELHKNYYKQNIITFFNKEKIKKLLNIMITTSNWGTGNYGGQQYTNEPPILEFYPVIYVKKGEEKGDVFVMNFNVTFSHTKLDELDELDGKQSIITAYVDDLEVTGTNLDNLIEKIATVYADSIMSTLYSEVFETEQVQTSSPITPTKIIGEYIINDSYYIDFFDTVPPQGKAICTEIGRNMKPNIDEILKKMSEEVANVSDNPKKLENLIKTDAPSYKRLFNMFSLIKSEEAEYLKASVSQLGGGKKPKFFEKRVINGVERRIYKLSNKLYVKTKSGWMSLKDYKMKQKNPTKK
jgi:hypothetical protein